MDAELSPYGMWWPLEVVGILPSTTAVNDGNQMLE